jgi:hypothetical protein
MGWTTDVRAIHSHFFPQTKGNIILFILAIVIWQIENGRLVPEERQPQGINNKRSASKRQLTLFPK